MKRLLANPSMRSASFPRRIPLAARWLAHWAWAKTDVSARPNRQPGLTPKIGAIQYMPAGQFGVKRRWQGEY